MLGHKCDVAVMALHPDWRVLRDAAERRCRRAGLDVVDSYVVDHRGQRVRQGHARAHAPRAAVPELPPEGKPVFCFYPMTKRREAPRQLVRHAVRRAQRR